MATCFQKHPFEIETGDNLTAINTKIFEIKKKIQLSEGQRKSHFEENEAEKQQNNDLINTLKKEIKVRLKELAQARAIVGDDEIQIKKYLSEICPIGDKKADQIIHNLDLKVIERRKMLDLLRYEKKSKKSKLRELEKKYESLLIESTRGALIKSKITNPAKKRASHLENEIQKVLIQWTEAELVKKKYYTIRQSLNEDAVKFESSLSQIEEMLNKQREEIRKLENVREEAAEMRYRATAAATAESAHAQDADHARAAERAYFEQRFNERKRELEKLEKRIFPPATRAVVRQESVGSNEGMTVTEEASAVSQMEEIFQRLMKLTGVTEAEEVFDRFQTQRETSKRLNYLQQITEEEKLELEQKQTALMAELEMFKFASVKDKDEAQDQITELKEEIRKEEETFKKLEKELEDLNTLLMEIKRLLYDACRLIDVITDPPIPEWTAEARDAQDIIMVLTSRYEKAQAKVQDINEKTQELAPTVAPKVVSNPTSGAASVAGISIHSHSTPKENFIEAAIPTYKALLQKEPAKAPGIWQRSVNFIFQVKWYFWFLISTIMFIQQEVIIWIGDIVVGKVNALFPYIYYISDEEEEIPSRCYLKRQAQLIVDTKCRRKGFRTPYPRR